MPSFVPVTYAASIVLALILLASDHSEAAAEVWTFDCQLARIDSEETLSLLYKLDAQSGTAFLEGNQGIEMVRAINGPKGISFIEPLATGAVQTTTITYEGDAVHSRHTIIEGLFPSQWRGYCTIGN